MVEDRDAGVVTSGAGPHGHADSATLARAGLGALRRGVVEGASEMTFLRSDGGAILGMALPHDVDVAAGLVQVGRLWTDLNIKA